MVKNYYLLSDLLITKKPSEEPFMQIRSMTYRRSKAASLRPSAAYIVASG